MANRIDSINLTVAQITDLTQPLSLAQGGVGATTPEGGRKTLGFDVMGIGVSTNALTSLDWQTFDFVPGALYSVSSGNMTNVPAGMDVPGPTYNTSIRAYGPEGGTRHVDVCFSTTTASAYRYYQVRLAGALGSRTMTVRQIWTSADVVPIANGGTGASTAAGARANLGFDSMGIGITNQTAISTLNWQQYDFVNGSYFLINSNNWTNAPTGFPTTASGGEVWHIEVTGIAGTSIQLQVTVNTITDNAFKTYSIRITGNKGSRSAKTRRLLVDTDEGITTPGNLIARTTLGSLPAAETLGASINSSLFVGTTENIATSLQSISPANSTLGLGRLAVFKKGATSAQDATAYFNFYSDGNFKMTGTITTGGLIATNIVANNSLSCGGSILANAGANVGVSPHNTNSNNGVRLWNSTSDVSEGQYVNTVGGGWYAGNWALGAVRGGSTDLRACQLNVSGGSGGGNASYMFKPNGIADALQWNNISDRRQKDNIKTVENPIEKMKQFHGVTFTYKNGVPSAGYIAQDVKLVLPEVVSEDHEGTLSMNVAGVGALHHEAILTLISQVEQLTLQVEELKTALANK